MDEAAAKYPLATLRGIGMLVDAVSADIMWTTATRLQRAILWEHAKPIVADVHAKAEQGDDRIVATTVTVDAHPRTLSSLRDKGFLDDHNRLTARAIHAALHTTHIDRETP
ncbi:hypothetical protein [Amycolatopsis palatopharyngis]|uniref:hypothetical protein n=1 Tax=Amycolatopsis palatopharyngis TaxID=187982 RepID=UPI000E21F019|nr:hypothetical protein [Amycolatopsis palatopharyngis]